MDGNDNKIIAPYFENGSGTNAIVITGTRNAFDSVTLSTVTDGISITGTNNTFNGGINNASAPITVTGSINVVFNGSYNFTPTLVSGASAFNISPASGSTNSLAGSLAIPAGNKFLLNGPSDANSYIGRDGGTGNTKIGSGSGVVQLVNSSTLAMGSQKITGLANGTAATDAVAFGQLVAPLAPTVVPLTDASTIAVNAALGNDCRVTLTASGHTLGNPSNPSDGQRILFQITQPASGGPYTILYGTAYLFSATLPAPTLSVTASLTDLLGFIYNATIGKWLFVSFVSGL
jgi:hypothetical protein